MKYTALLIFFIFSTHAELLRSDYIKPFIPADTKEGPLSLEQIQRLEEALNQIGHQQVFNSLREKLRISDMDGVRMHIQSCNTPPDVFGTYKRGRTFRYKKSYRAGIDPNNVQLFWSPQKSILDEINESFRVKTENNPAYASLVLQSWPTICLRPGVSLGDTLSFFAHEVQHFIGDDYTEIDHMNLEVEEYVEQKLLSSGGEYEAFQAGARVLISLRNIGRLLSSYGSYLIYFDYFGNLINPQGFKKYILDSLGYRKRFTKRYHDAILKDQEAATKNRETLADYLALYTERLEHREEKHAIYLDNIEIAKSNIELHLNNIKIVKNSIKIQGKYTQEDLVHYQDLLKKQRDRIGEIDEEIKRNKTEITYFSNLILLTEGELEKTDEFISTFKK